MKLSIDLDDTILVTSESNQRESNSSPLIRGSITEYFRKGTRELFDYLNSTDYEVGIYTNSYRGKTDLLNWFEENNYQIDFVINQQIHDCKIDSQHDRHSLPDKCPHLFNIDIHLDDLEHIKNETEKFGTQVILVNSTETWIEETINELKKIG